MDHQEQPLSLNMALQFNTMQSRDQNQQPGMYMMQQDQDMSFHQEWEALEHVLRHQPSPIAISGSMDAITNPLPSPQSFTTVDTSAFINDSVHHLTPELPAVAMDSIHTEYQSNTPVSANYQSPHEMSPDPTLSEWLMQMQISQQSGVLNHGESLSHTPSPSLMASTNHHGGMSQGHTLSMDSCSNIVDSCMPLSMLIGQTSMMQMPSTLSSSPPSPPVTGEQRWPDMLMTQDELSPSLIPFPDIIPNSNYHDGHSENVYVWPEATTMTMNMPTQTSLETVATIPGHMRSVSLPSNNEKPIISTDPIRGRILPNPTETGVNRSRSLQQKQRNGKAASTRSKRSGSNAKDTNTGRLSPRPLSIRANPQPSSVAAIRSRYMGGNNPNRPRASSTSSTQQQPRPSPASLGIESTLKFDISLNQVTTSSSKRNSKSNNNTRRRAITISNGQSATQECNNQPLMPSMMLWNSPNPTPSDGALTPPTSQGPMPVNRSQSDSPKQNVASPPLLMKPQPLTVTQSCPASNRKKTALAPLTIPGRAIMNQPKIFPSQAAPVARLPLPPLVQSSNGDNTTSAPGTVRRSRPSIDLTSVDLDDVTVTTLKRLLRRYNRDTRGKKAELVLRVREEIELAKTATKQSPTTITCNASNYRFPYPASIMSAPVSPITETPVSDIAGGSNTTAILPRRSLDDARPNLSDLSPTNPHIMAPINPITPPLSQSDLGSRTMATAAAATADHILDDDDPLSKAAAVTGYATNMMTTPIESWPVNSMNDWILNSYKTTLPPPSSTPSSYYPHHYPHSPHYSSPSSSSSQAMYDMTDHYTTLNESTPDNNNSNHLNLANHHGNTHNYNNNNGSNYYQPYHPYLNTEDETSTPTMSGPLSSNSNGNNNNEYTPYNASMIASSYPVGNDANSAWSYVNSPTTAIKPSGVW
ncbi:hypothetical protein BDF19DRAFT_463531 [Syncephalis fuscata]|nr:hypothetical protein BDF19DRAFT_463531 [Syncephalis fuscata]